MKINTTTFNDFVKNALVKWREGFSRVPLVAKSLYDVSMSDELTSEHSSMDGFTFARRKPESDDYFKQNPTQNYSKTMTKYRIGIAADITWEMRKYDKYREISKVLSGLGEEVAQRMELDLTHRLTFATATSYTDMDGETVSTTVGDGLALLSTAHTVRGSSTTYRNRIANNPAFSRSGLEAGEKLFATQMIDSNGNKVVVKPDTIITTDDPSTTNTVKEFLNSTASPAVSNSGVVNVYESKYKHLVLPYLATTGVGAYDSTKDTLWFLANVGHTDAVCEISEMPHMVSPSPGGNGEDFDNDDWKFKASAAYGIEIVDPKWIVGSTGDSAA